MSGSRDARTDAERLAFEVVRSVFHSELGREPAAEEYHYQAEFMLERRLTVEEFGVAIRTTGEGLARQARVRGFGPNQSLRFDGCSFVLPGNSFLADSLQLPGGYEPWALPLFLEHCRPGSTVIDVGANWGIYAIPAARRVGPAGQVFAFEPNPKNAKILIRNTLRNDLRNLQLLTCGVSDRFGLAALPHDEAQNSGFVITDPGVATHQALEWEPISTVPLAAMRGSFGRVDLVKMDIEGGEYRACLGALSILREDRPVVFLEFTPILLRGISKVEPAALLKLFLDLGYTIDVLPQVGGPVRLRGDDSAVIERACAWCDDVVTHVDLRIMPAVT